MNGSRLFFLVAVLASGCEKPEPPAAAPERLPAKEHNEFRAIAESLYESDNPYLGRRQLPRQQALVDGLAAASPSRVNAHLALCWTQLRLGQVEEAAGSVTAAFADVAAIGGRPNLPMLKLRAFVYLREAENRNCVERHTARCCLFPLAGDGIHSIKEPASQALDSLLAMLQEKPEDLEARWLLNITGMALGGYPENIPAAFRFPETAFQGSSSSRRFVDIASGEGVATFNLCGGTAVEDFNGDGRFDIATTSYDPQAPLTLYFQSGDGFDEVSVESQLGGLNVVSADYDNDGDFDLLVLRGAWLENQGQIRNSLLQNDGTGRFTDVTASAGLAFPAYPTQAAAWADFDNDGHLDLYIGNESRRGDPEPGGDYPSQLFRSDGDGTFTDIAASAGVTNDRYCKGVCAGDIDNDGLIDLYVSNRGANRLYRNLGNLRFEDVAPAKRMTEPSQGSFACWFFDPDNDGDLDLFVSAYQSENADVAASALGLPHDGRAPCLYRNNGDGTFEDIASPSGLGGAYLPMGANFGDIDNDGFLDIYLTTGRPDFGALMPNVMLQNRGRLQFEDVTTATGLGHLQKGHGVAFADLDGDGDQDIYHQLGGFYPADRYYNALFENLPSGSQGRPHRYLAVDLVGTRCNRQAIGARVRIAVESPEGPRKIHRAAGFVSSFGGSPSRLEIGLGDASSITAVEVTWPGAREQSDSVVLTGVGLDSRLQIVQDQVPE